MATVQLRRYQILPGEMDAFVEWWADVRDVREQYGFDVLFAFIDETTNQFVWAVKADGDFDEIESQYLKSPERAAISNDPHRYGETFITKVKVVHQGWE